MTDEITRGNRPASADMDDSRNSLESLFPLYRDTFAKIGETSPRGQQPENAQNHDALAKAGEATPLGQQLKDTLSKMIAVSVASHFEAEAKATITGLVKELAGTKGQILLNLIQNKILDRGYHGLFDWNAKNVNHFYSAFNAETSLPTSNSGLSGFKKFMQDKESKDDAFKQSALCFLRLGKARNDLVHGDLASARSSSSLEEIKQDYEKAKAFLPKFRAYSLEFSKRADG